MLKSLDFQNLNPDLQVPKENHGQRKKDRDQVQRLIPDPYHLIAMKSHKNYEEVHQELVQDLIQDLIQGLIQDLVQDLVQNLIQDLIQDLINLDLPVVVEKKIHANQILHPIPHQDLGHLTLKEYLDLVHQILKFLAKISNMTLMQNSGHYIFKI